MSTYTLEDAIRLVRFIEPTLSKKGYHSAITGSTLYKGVSEKDVDIIIYAHDPEATLAKEGIALAMVDIGLYLVRFTEEEYTGRQVIIMKHGEMRADLIILK